MNINGIFLGLTGPSGEQTNYVNKKDLSSNQNTLDKAADGINKQDKNKKIYDDKLTLSKDALLIIQKLKTRDREVRQHERAHMAAGGPYITGGPTYTYQTGPDGKRYAIAGEVHIDTSPEKDPEATIRKMETVKRAALAPSNPSTQDRLVAAKASMEEQKAHLELLKEKRDEASHLQEKDNHLESQKEGGEDG